MSSTLNTLKQDYSPVPNVAVSQSRNTSMSSTGALSAPLATGDYRSDDDGTKAIVLAHGTCKYVFLLISHLIILLADEYIIATLPQNQECWAGCQQSNYRFGTISGLILFFIMLFAGCDEFLGLKDSPSGSDGGDFDFCVDNGLVPGAILIVVAEFIAWLLLRRATKTTLVLTNRRIVKMTSIVRKCCPIILAAESTTANIRTSWITCATWRWHGCVSVIWIMFFLHCILLNSNSIYFLTILDSICTRKARRKSAVELPAAVAPLYVQICIDLKCFLLSEAMPTGALHSAFPFVPQISCQCTTHSHRTFFI